MSTAEPGHRLQQVKPMELPPAPWPDPLRDPLSRALVAVAVERGYGATTIAAVIDRAGVSRSEFDRRHAGLDACAVDTAGRLIAAFKRRAGAAFNSQADWRSGLRLAAYEAADWMEEYSETVTFGTAEVLHVGDEMARVGREEVFLWCAEMIERGREAAPPGSVPEGASAMAIGSILQLLSHRLQEGAEIRPYEAVRESLYGVIRIYLGEEAAREELTLPRPGEAPGDRDGDGARRASEGRPSDR